jgi:hypothetical protein
LKNKRKGILLTDWLGSYEATCVHEPVGSRSPLTSEVKTDGLPLSSISSSSSSVVVLPAEDDNPTSLSSAFFPNSSLHLS